MAEVDAELELLLHQKAFFDENPGAGQLRIGDDEPLYVSIRFHGDPAALAQAGFTMASAVGNIAYGVTNLAGLAALINHPQVETIQKQRRMNTRLDDSVPDIKANQIWSRSGDNFTGYTGRGVIIGVIDTGIDFRHKTFRKADNSSRVLKIWDQTLTAGAGESAPGAITTPSIADVPTPLGYGVEYGPGAIAGALADPPTSTVRHVDADGHGTHVCGIAAGDGSQNGGCHGTYTYVGVATEADLIVVRLWGLTTGDSTTAPTSNSVKLDAIRYLLEQARVASKALVINLSLGFFSDVMDGTHNDCTSVDTLLTANSAGRAIVYAAGNDGDAGFHATGTVPAGPTATLALQFELAPDDTKARTVVVRYTGSNLRAKLTSPVSGAAGVINFVSVGAPGNSATANGTGAGSLVTVSNSANRIAIAITPPTGTATAPGKNMPGRWTLELQDSGSTATAIDAFCLFGSSHDAKSPRFVDHTTTRSTLDTDASGRECISVGSYKVGGRLSSFSGRGPTLDTPPRTKPEIAAPGEDITSAGLPGDRTGCQSCCCECCQDFYVDKSGTSMSAPHIAGVVALMLHKNPGLTHTQVKAALTANSGPPPGDATPDELVGWGAGKVDAKRIVDAVTQVNPPVTREVIAPADAFEPVRARFLATERGPVLQRLFEKYFREVYRLVQTNRRVATIWHRCKGPMWVRLALKAVYMPAMPVPFEADGVRLQDGFARFAGIVARYASPELLRDVLPLTSELSRLRDGMTLETIIDVLGRSHSGHSDLMPLGV